MEAVPRHPVVNEDDNDTLLRVTLHSEHEVTATKAKAFLKRVGNRVVGMDGKDLCVGDRLPVSRVLPIDPGIEVTHLELAEYLPKTEFTYMSEVEKVLAAHAADGEARAAYPAANDARREKSKARGYIGDPGSSG